MECILQNIDYLSICSTSYNVLCKDYSTFYQLNEYQNLPLRMCNIRVAVARLATLHEYVPLSLADAVAR